MRHCLIRVRCTFAISNRRRQSGRASVRSHVRGPSPRRGFAPWIAGVRPSPARGAVRRGTVGGGTGGARGRVLPCTPRAGVVEAAGHAAGAPSCGLAFTGRARDDRRHVRPGPAHDARRSCPGAPLPPYQRGRDLLRLQEHLGPPQGAPRRPRVPDRSTRRHRDLHVGRRRARSLSLWRVDG
jgi:hypothetical protein